VDTVLYFAYGSNMSTDRLRARVPSAKPVDRGQLEGYQLLCNKQSVDGSGKANVGPCSSSVVWGVLFEIDPSGLPSLDRAEGGYERVLLPIRLTTGKKISAYVYVARQDRVMDDPVPYDWYKRLIVEGAQEHNLPAEYIETLKALPSRTDISRSS